MVDPTYMREKLPFPCPQCNHTSQPTFGEVVGSDEIACENCGHMLDISDEELQEQWRVRAADVEQIKPQ